MADSANSTRMPAVRPGSSSSPAPLPGLSAALSRRAALFGAVAATVAPTAVPAAPVAADAHLTRLVAELRANFEAFEALPADGDLQDHPTWDALIDRENLLVDTLCDTEAKGPVGLVAKARALQLRSVSEDFEATGRIAQSMADDILRLLGGRSYV